MLNMAKILRISNEHMSYKVFSIDDHTKLCQINYADVIMMTDKAPRRRAGSVHPYSRVDDTYLTHYPWNGEAHSRPVCEGLFCILKYSLNTI